MLQFTHQNGGLSALNESASLLAAFEIASIVRNDILQHSGLIMGKKLPKKGKPAHKTAPHELRQLQIIHLSDMHFGRYHQFNPETSPGGDALAEDGVRTLAQKLMEDLSCELSSSCSEAMEAASPFAASPTIACLTGDFAETASYEEFKSAEAFVRELADAPYLQPEGLDNVFTVPGNHDVGYDKADLGERWLNYTDFHNRLHSGHISSKHPSHLDALHDRVSDLGAIILCINSATFVEKDKPDEQRGQITEDQLAKIRAMLTKVPRRRRDSAIRVALVHHHPVLVPPLAERDRNYDAIQRSGHLLNILHEFGFHLLLHGHKHLPLTFPEDMRNAFEITKDHSMLIVAGGSVGSKGLPAPAGTNTYNLITVKWHQAAGQTRIRIITKGLETHHSKTKQPLISRDWKWRLLREDDRSTASTDSAQKPIQTAIQLSDPPSDAEDKDRKAQYSKTRRNMPVVEVRPSLIPDQAYESTFWLIPHKPIDPGYERPTRVTWTAGRLFPTITISAEDDPRFCATFDYWGPMLVEGKLEFADGTTAQTYVYARVPSDEGA